MPIFILAGFQRNLAPRIKKALKNSSTQLAGWTGVAFVGHKDNAHDIGLGQINQLLKLAEAHDGAHIFGVSSSKTRDQTKNQIRPHFRFRWLDAKPIGLVGAGDEATMINALSVATIEETYWLDKVKPKNSASPLTLPAIFACQRELEDIWRLSESYNNQGHLEAAAKRITQFTNFHRRRIDGFKNTPWCAEDDWIWDDDGDRHGTPLFPMDWKYSLKLPDGFHFDVSAKVKGKTHFTDINGKSHAYKTHMNVTAHGEIRGDTIAAGAPRAANV